jgi:hypothetical protein
LTFAGTASPIDFNGLVRHYYLRRDANRGNVRVNLVPKKDRQQQSHEIVLRLRNGLEDIGRRHGARIKIVEVPPGPPVLSTIVAEVYSRPDQSYSDSKADAAHIRRLFETEPGVVDVDDTFEAVRSRYVFPRRPLAAPTGGEVTGGNPLPQEVRGVRDAGRGFGDL